MKRPARVALVAMAGSLLVAAAMAWASRAFLSAPVEKPTAPTENKAHEAGVNREIGAIDDAIAPTQSRERALPQYYVRLSDQFPVAGAELDLEEGADRVAGLTSDANGLLLSFPAALDPFSIRLTCSSFPWLPAASFKPATGSGCDGIFTIQGGKLEVVMDSAVQTEAAVYVKLQSESNRPYDDRKLSTRTGQSVIFLLVDEGIYSLHAVTADGRLYGEATIRWHTGIEQVRVTMREPGCGILDVSVVDSLGAEIHPFALELAGTDGFQRIVHSEDLPLGSLLVGLPEGRLSVQLVPRLVAPPSLYRPGVKGRVQLAAGEVRKLSLTTSRLGRFVIDVTGDVRKEWEFQCASLETGVWEKVEVSRFLEGGGTQLLRFISKAGVYYSDSLDATARVYRFVSRDSEDVVAVSDGLNVGVVTRLRVALR